jgi:hypothetical protein
MIDIASLTEGDLGRWVTYRKGPRVNRGRIKGWSDQFVYVVYWAGSALGPIQRLLCLVPHHQRTWSLMSPEPGEIPFSSHWALA